MCPMVFPGGSDSKKKNQLAIQGTWVWSLGWEDPLEIGMATHYSILAWEIPRIESMWSQRVRQDWATRHSCTHGYFMFLAYNPLKSTSSSSFWPGFQGVLYFFSITYFSVLRPCWGFPDGSDGKESPCSAGNIIPGSGRAFGEGNGIPLHSCLELAAHPSILGWEIPWTEESGVLQSVGLQRVVHDWVRTHTDHAGCHLFFIVLLKVK